MVLIFIMGGYQHFQDDSLLLVLRVLEAASSSDAILCAALFTSSVISLVHNAIIHRRIRHIKSILLSIISFMLSASFLCIAIAIKLASEGI